MKINRFLLSLLFLLISTLGTATAHAAMFVQNYASIGLFSYSEKQIATYNPEDGKQILISLTPYALEFSDASTGESLISLPKGFTLQVSRLDVSNPDKTFFVVSKTDGGSGGFYTTDFWLIGLYDGKYVPFVGNASLKSMGWRHQNFYLNTNTDKVRFDVCTAGLKYKKVEFSFDLDWDYRANWISSTYNQ